MNAQLESRDSDQPPLPTPLDPAKAGLFAGDDPAAKRRTECISFSIGEEQYGVDIMAVREIKGWSEITHLPKQPDYVRGVLNLRGVMVPIIDLRCRFGQGHTEASALHVVIVVQVEARLIGLLADRVLDILSFEAGPDPGGSENRQLLRRRFPVRAGHPRRRHDRPDRSSEPAFRDRCSRKCPGCWRGRSGNDHDVTLPATRRQLQRFAAESISSGSFSRGYVGYQANITRWLVARAACVMVRTAPLTGRQCSCRNVDANSARTGECRVRVLKLNVGTASSRTPPT
jgi:chemotaxis signal transduction protein